MKSLILAGFLLLTTQATPPAPKNNPNGTWESTSGTKYALRLSGKDLHVEMVEGSNSRYLKYEVDLKNEEEANTYSGSGFFVAKLANGKECKYPTEWKLVVVTPDRIFGSTTNIVPDPCTGGVQDRHQTRQDSKKK